jgi:hypothetical protein
MMALHACVEGEMVMMVALLTPVDFEVLVLVLVMALDMVMDSCLIDMESDAPGRGLPHHPLLEEAHPHLEMGHPHGPTASSKPLNSCAVQFPLRLSTM